MALSLDFWEAEVLKPEGLRPERLSIAEGQIVEPLAGRRVNLEGYKIMPGLVDVHGDAFERHVAPRRGAMKQATEGLLAAEAELAANGVTTGVLAQFMSWEGGVRSAEFAGEIFSALAKVRPHAVTDMRGQLRLETHFLEAFEGLPEKLAGWGVEYVVFNDHLPHARLAAGRKPPGLNGQALKAGRSPEAHLAFLHELHERDVSAPLADLAKRLNAIGIRMGSHDDATAGQRSEWRRLGAVICEFPETLEAAEAARAAGDLIAMGSPNVVRGGSHKGNISALDLITLNLCDALASDYHYPSMRRAVLFIAKAGLCDLAAAWRLISEGPAELLGLSDRGVLEPGKRADLVILDANDQIAATIAGGRISHMRGDIAERFFA